MCIKQANDITVGGRGAKSMGTTALHIIWIWLWLIPVSETRDLVSVFACFLYDNCQGNSTHHHQVTILGPVDDGLLATLEVYKALSARLDVKANAAANISMIRLHTVCRFSLTDSH